MHDKLKPYLAALADSKLPDHAIARMAKLDGKTGAAEVKAARAELAAAASTVPAAVEPVVAEVAEAEPVATVDAAPLAGDGPERDERWRLKDIADAAHDIAAILRLDIRDTDKGETVDQIRAIRRVLATVAAEDAPSHVRVVAKGAQRLHRPPGAPVRVAYRDVHAGDMAAWLWTHHRALVEPYSPAKG